MVQIPSYMKLVVDNAPKKSHAATRKSHHTTENRPPEKTGKVATVNFKPDTVELSRTEASRVIDDLPPSSRQAERALEQLKQDLPQLGQGVGDLHSKLDRRVILSLLAPLVST